MQKGLVRFKFVSLKIDLNDPPAIANLYHQVRDEKGVVIAEGTTDGQGYTVYISRDRGAVLSVYIKNLVTGKLKHKYTHVIRDKKATVEVMSSKILLDDIPLLKHTGDKGKYKRHVHEVKAGETLSGLAKKYNTTVALFMSVNKGIKSADKIAVGQKLLIPPKGMSQLAKAPVKAKSPPPSSSAQATSPNTTQSNTVQPSSAPPSSGAGSSLPTSSSSTANTSSTSPAASTPPAPASSVSTSQPSTGAGSPSPAPAIVPMQTTSASSGNPVAVVNGQACVCRAYDLIWGAKVSCEFRRKVVQICEDVWPQHPIKMANMLMAVFQWEGAGRFRSDTPNMGKLRDGVHDEGTGATGMLQIMPATYKHITGEEAQIERVHNYYGDGRYHKRVKQLARMTPIEYLDIVKRYFEPLRNNTTLEFVDFYLQVLFPASSGKPEHAVFVRNVADLPFPNEQQSVKDKRVSKYTGNSGLDVNGDGKIMKSEIALKVEHFMTDGAQNFNKQISQCAFAAIVPAPIQNTGQNVNPKIIVIDPGHGINGGNAGTQIRLLKLKRSFGDSNFIVGNLYSWKQLPDFVINNANEYLSFVENRDVQYPTEAEYAYNQAIALKLKLELAGHKVYLTRDNPRSENVSQISLVQSLNITSQNPIAYRGRIANAIQAHYLISLHCDGSSTNLEANEAKILYKYSEPANRSKTLCESIKASYSKIPGRVLSDMANNPNNLLGVLSTTITARYKVLVEMGYMTSPAHMRILIEDASTIVNDLAIGILDHINSNG